MKRLLTIGLGIGLAAGAARAESYFQDAVTEWMIGPNSQQRMQDPLRYLADDMGQIKNDLGAMRTGAPVQKQEKQVVAHLDELIKLLEKQCNGSGSGGGRNPTKPMNASRIARGPGGQGEMISARENGREWGKLPPQLREQILQSHTDGFPPGYETILQSYYQRLAQEKVADAGGDRPTSPTTRPGNR